MSEKFCTGACLFGKCPFPHCIRANQKTRRAVKLNAAMNILTDGADIGIASDKSGIGAAIDIGTTTVAAALYDMGASKLIGTRSKLNSQASLGVDVISRIKFSGEEGGLDALRDAIIGDINDLLGGFGRDDISACVITGNTTMLHLVAGVSPVTMGYLPFAPASLFGSSRSLGKSGVTALDNNGTDAYLADCISSFVGGDITCAILASGMMDAPGDALLLDIGTNGEVALKRGDELFVTSTAAGPAFEGAAISCGMAGVNGAVSRVSPLMGKIDVETVGGVKAAGICGSGLLDAVALMLDTEVIDETGAFTDTDSPFAGTVNGQRAFFVTDGVYITQGDIRELQTAKAAIAAGVDTLLHTAGIEWSGLSAVYLAGGFGNFLDPASAARIGIFPKESLDRITPIGNGALAGAAMMLMREDNMKKAVAIAKKGEHVELGHNPYFMDRYIDCMMF